MKNIGWVLVLVTLVCTGCGPAKQASPEELAEVMELLESRKFEMQANWAIPLATNSLNQIMNAGLLPPWNSASRISLIGIPNYIRFEGDSVKAQLPYYGERQMGGGYGNPGEAGVVFDGLINDPKLSFNERKQFYTLEFSTQYKTESYRAVLTVFPNKSANLQVNSSQRFTIGYQGAVTPLKEEEEKDKNY